MNSESQVEFIVPAGAQPGQTIQIQAPPGPVVTPVNVAYNVEASAVVRLL